MNRFQVLRIQFNPIVKSLEIRLPNSHSIENDHHIFNYNFKWTKFDSFTKNFLWISVLRWFEHQKTWEDNLPENVRNGRMKIDTKSGILHWRPAKCPECTYYAIHSTNHTQARVFWPAFWHPHIFRSLPLFDTMN